ncbi:protein of unknown function UPF0047 [Methanosalsum zhilinae DSM 4017]|uniref:Secondary thiamine-phosphate synthase enzyme n=1 Tax=Methanosalsum zhilinae (strain DSM 4017 / NBRC 107636 / OCM 62 / WeN5) TaxID=679901 RepID=F7XQB6_METZD|nr:secondary thiamine-phosphate synthase enzyme YjbQ [Methanosalsum zhilinae]AEH61578.1 protein of unknown function UPF0047 [Methanosalsum zhilinae DSM 4017]
MSAVTASLNYETSGNNDIRDITSDVIQSVGISGIRNGIVLVFTPGSTVAITTLEYEPGLVTDLKDALERLAPQDIEYFHNQRWHDGNGHSHIRAALLGQDCSFPIIDGQVELGTWQQIILIDLDVRPRNRKVTVQIVGD